MTDIERKPELEESIAEDTSSSGEPAVESGAQPQADGSQPQTSDGSGSAASVGISKAAKEAEAAEVAQAIELSDDPVRMYLKEIGRVDLLATDQELWLFARMEAEKSIETYRAELTDSKGIYNPITVQQ